MGARVGSRRSPQPPVSTTRRLRRAECITVAGQGATPSFVEQLASGQDAHLIPSPLQTERRTAGVVATMNKALAEGTGSAGEYLVSVETAGEVLRMLRARSAVMRLGPTVVPVKKELDLTALSTGASASYVAEVSGCGLALRRLIDVQAEDPPGHRPLHLRQPLGYGFRAHVRSPTRIPRRSLTYTS